MQSNKMLNSWWIVKETNHGQKCYGIYISLGMLNREWTFPKRYIPNRNRGRKQRFYRDLLTAWTDLINNEKVDPTTLSEIYNEQLFFNASSITHNNQFEYLMKIPTPWARERFWMVGDICKKNAPGFISMGELLSTNAQKTFRYGPKSKDLT